MQPESAQNPNCLDRAGVSQLYRSRLHNARDPGFIPTAGNVFFFFFFQAFDVSWLSCSAPWA